MEKLKWRTAKKKVSDLLPNEKNPRKISKKQMNDLTRSLKKFDLVEIPVLDMDNTILAGHQRIKALQLLERGDEVIDVRIPNRKLSNDEVDRYMIGSNSLGGEWDFDKLQVFTPELLSDLGFEPIDISAIWDSKVGVEDDDFDEKKELEKLEGPIVELGDLIHLGQHRLICGDSTKKDVLQRLFGEDKASMIYSDPVYNLKGGINYSTGIGGKQNYGGNVNDDRSEIEYKNLIKESMERAFEVSHDDLHVFYWSDQTYIWLMQSIYKELGIQNKRVCIWAKNGANPTPQVAFNKAYEPCTYGVRGKPFLTNKKDLTEFLNKDIRNGNDALTDIWAVKRLPRKEYMHATTKPPTLHEKPILRCTKPGDIVLDSFAGSGSTLIACEQLKRKAYCVELEPRFCDLIIKRYEKLTGTKVKIIKSHEKCQEKAIPKTV